GDRRRRGRSGSRHGQRYATAEGGQEQRLLLIDERLESSLGRFLRVEELLVQRRRLLLHPLERGETLLGHQQRLGERIRVGGGHRDSLRGRLRANPDRKGGGGSAAPSLTLRVRPD